MRRGRRLGIDPGSVRIGVAQSDPDGILSTPLETLNANDPDLREHYRALLEEIEPLEVIFGLPVALSTRHTSSTEQALELAKKFAEWGEVPLRLVDERLTTVSAQHALSSLGKSTKKSRNIIDQVAAVIILQDALDFERQSGNPPGRLFLGTEED